MTSTHLLSSLQVGLAVIEKVTGIRVPTDLPESPKQSKYIVPLPWAAGGG